jgi:hypothetical protein
MDNITIHYEIRINKGKEKGKIVEFNTDLDELENEPIPNLLIEKGHLECWCNNDEYTVLGRKIISIEN